MHVREQKLVSFGRRLKAPTIMVSNAAVDFIKPFYKDVMEVKEVFYILCLNNANRVVGVSKISEGGINSCSVDVRLVLRTVLMTSGAVGMICFHNHPSGRAFPSQKDRDLTDKLQKAAEAIDLTLVDHIILTDHSYYSLSNEGDM